MLKLVKRVKSQNTLNHVAQDVAEESGMKFLEVLPPQGYTYQAAFEMEGGEAIGLFLANHCEECPKDESPSIVIAFSHGQMVACHNGHVHHIERDEWFDEIGAGDE